MRKQYGQRSSERTGYKLCPEETVDKWIRYANGTCVRLPVAYVSQDTHGCDLNDHAGSRKICGLQSDIYPGWANARQSGRCRGMRGCCRGCSTHFADGFQNRSGHAQASKGMSAMRPTGRVAKLDDLSRGVGASLTWLGGGICDLDDLSRQVGT